MKKAKRFVSILLTVVMVFSVFTTVPMTTAYAAGGIQTKINQLKSVYGDGTYFTVSGGPCWNSGGSDCYLPSIPSRGGLPAGSECKAKGNSCWGFANYAFYYIFGSLPKNNTKTYSPSLGDYVAVNLGYGEHYGILVGEDSSNYYIYDCNGDWSYVPSLGYKTSTCKMITSHKCAKSTFRYAYHANNYAQVDGVSPVTYYASTGSASNITNANATISGSANASNGKWPYVNSWGYYYGTSNNPTNKKTVSWPNTYVSSLSCNMKDQCGALSPGTTYYYKIWAVIDNKEYCGNVQSFRTASVKPSAATIRTSAQDIGLGVNPVFTWNTSNYADSYKVELKNSNGDVVQSRSDITGTTYSFNGLNKTGDYTATIYSVNSVGSTQGNSVKITVHPNSTVKFIDVNPETKEEVVVKEQSVVYGGNATAPANPSKTGYTFKKWDGIYTNVKSNTNVKSVYEINTYTVKFINSYTGELLKTESVKYKHSATPPEYTLPKGYIEVENGWDKDYTKILEDTTLYSVIQWENPDIPMYIDSISAKRFTDTATYNNEGYEVTVNLHNWDESLTTGRLIVALMTDDGQLLTETESSAFYLKKSATKTVEVFVPYKDEVDFVRVFVVDQYSTATPISESVICDNISVIGDEYTFSYNTAPKAGTYDPDSLTKYTEYRYKTKSTTTSYDTSMSGWTQNGYQLIHTGDGTIQYVPSWPWGFDTNSSLYRKYNNSPVSAYENTTSKRDVTTTDGNYLYWHWSYPLSGYHSEANRLYGEYYNLWLPGCGYTTIFEAIETNYRLPYVDYAKSFQKTGSSTYTYWWTASMDGSNVDLRVKNCNYSDYRKLYNYYKWSAWSGWSTTAKSKDSNTEVETRTVYKYIPYIGKPKPVYFDLSSYKTEIPYGVYAWHFDNGAQMGYGYFTKPELDESGYYKTEMPAGENVVFALTSDGKEPDDMWSNVIMQTEDLAFDGKNNLFTLQKTYISYDKPVHLVDYGVYTPPVEVESTRTVSGKISSEFAGKQAALFIYKVNSASDYTNEYIGQTVIGKDGSYEFKFRLREEPTIETGDFTVVLNLEGATAPIYLDPIVAPKKEYTVTFYDYDYSGSEPKKVEISKQVVKEGDNATLPNDKLLGREGYTFSNWSATATNVHSNLEITAEYEINEYTVVFVDWNARSVDIQKFNHGDILIAPQPEDVDAATLVQWDAIADGVTTVTHDMVVCTEYTTRKCNVTVTDFDGNVIEEKTVNYGDYISLPEFTDSKYDEYNLIGWTNESKSGIGEETETADTLLENAIVTENCYLCPVYEFEETVLNPEINISGGEYTEPQTIELTCGTENAQIYYTLDGSDPTSNKGILYTAPIVIEDKAKLSFYATAMEMNDSAVNYEYYVINPTNAKSAWMTYDKLPAEVKANPSEYLVTQEIGYSYKDITQTSSKAEYEQLIANGWTYITSEESDVSDYLDEPYVDDDLIGLKNESVDVYGNGFQVSHYKYTLDGVEGICKDESFAPEGAVGKVETVQAVSFGSIAGFDENSNNAPYYLYNGEKWYNRKSAQVVVGQQYCYTHQIAYLYKWTDYTIEAPSATETRETKSTDVYSYEKMKHYIVDIYSVFGYVDSNIYKINSKLDMPGTMYGYDFDGYYSDLDFTQPIDIENYKVTESTILFAKFTPKKYTVQFTFMDGTEIETQEVEYLSAANAPELPDVPNYVFVGWETDFQHIEGDTTVRAIYVKESEYSAVSLDKDSVKIIEGNSTKLTPIFDIENVALELEWTSSNNNVATVDKEGVVTAVSEGTAIITAKVKGMPESAECTITVVGDTVNKLSLKDDSKLDIDKETGTLRRIKAGSNNVSQIIANFTNTDISVTDSEGLTLISSDSVGTGAIICLMKDGKVADKLVAVMVADVSGDGKVNLKDASLISRFLIDDFSDPTDYQIYAMDVNGDGSANNKDAALVLQYLVGKVKV